MDKNKHTSVIIVAGGKGKRMESETPKQFLKVAGLPVMMHTIKVFHNWKPRLQIVVVLPFDHIETWNRLCSENRFIIPHQITAGGDERFDSVKNGLNIIPDQGLVAIHDGVRPLVSAEVIGRSFEAAEKYGGAIPVVAPSESIRYLEKGVSKPVNRNNYLLVQTPQTFSTPLIKNAYKNPYEPGFTDDATVFEADGNVVHLIEGNPENIKITRPFDMKVAESYLRNYFL